MPYRKCHITGLTILWAALLAAPAARAQGGAAAEVLFEQGRQAMAAGIFDTACEKFRASEKLDPAPGTTLNLAECELRRGRLATAWELFRAVSSKLPPGDPRRPVAERRLAELEPRLPRVTFRLRPGSPAATTVRLGTAELGAGSLGVMLPLDPGAHRAVVTAPGHGAQAFSLTLAEGQKLELDVAPGPPAGCAQDDLDAVEGQAVATNVLFGAAGVAAATARA
ncbi:MAG: hypothetical protein HY744_32885 [Deltaproteobacteria bacterium]|nr:hypothetical protein [Deltaproteobacteria bacterium]